MARHDWTPASRERGTIRVMCDGGRLHWLRLIERDALTAALDRGDVWYAGTDNFGAAVRVRLDDVVAVTAFTPESIAATIADDERSAAEDDATGKRWKAEWGTP